MEIELKSLHSTSTTTRKNWNEEKEKNESKATSLSYNSKNDDDGRKIVECTRYLDSGNNMNRNWQTGKKRLSFDGL